MILRESCRILLGATLLQDETDLQVRDWKVILKTAKSTCTLLASCSMLTAFCKGAAETWARVRRRKTIHVENHTLKLKDVLLLRYKTNWWAYHPIMGFALGMGSVALLLKVGFPLLCHFLHTTPEQLFWAAALHKPFSAQSSHSTDLCSCYGVWPGLRILWSPGSRCSCCCSCGS